jgi:hypothetical protein
MSCGLFVVSNNSRSTTGSAQLHGEKNAGRRKADCGPRNALATGIPNAERRAPNAERRAWTAEPLITWVFGDDDVGFGVERTDIH